MSYALLQNSLSAFLVQQIGTSCSFAISAAAVGLMKLNFAWEGNELIF